MNKEEWQNLYNNLESLLSDFINAYKIYRNGKNQKVRDEAKRLVDNTIYLAKNHIRSNWEIFELVTGGANKNDYERKIIYDEFLLPKYFATDMSDFLNLIKRKIESFDGFTNHENCSRL